MCWVRDDADDGSWAWTAKGVCHYNNDEVNQQPDAPHNPSPSDGSNGVKTSPTLSVDVSDSDGDTMDVSFYDSNDNLIGTESSVSSGGTASVTWSGADSEATTYSWYAEADDGNKVNTQSDTWSFTTEGQAPDAPTNPSPSDGATDVPRSPTDLSVDVSDPEGNNMDVRFYDSSDNLIGTDSGVASGDTASATWSNTDPSTTYKWYAVADDGKETQSSTWSFTTEPNNPPNQPTDLKPSGDSEPLSPDINASYSDPDGDSGTLYFETDSGSSIGSCSVSDGGKCSVTYSSADEPDTTYTFQVYAEDEYGDTSSKVSQSFTTESGSSSTSNSDAPAGSVWIESDELHWADGSNEKYLDNANLVESGSPGPSGAWWIESSAMHWIDQNGDERSYTASDTGSDPSGASPGQVWIEGGTIHYIDASGNERAVQ